MSGNFCMQLTLKDICEKFWFLEKKFNLFNFKIENIVVWSDLRIYMYSQIAQRTGLSNMANYDLYRKAGAWEKIKNEINYLTHACFNNNVFSGNYIKDVLVFQHGRFKYIDGRYIDIYSDALVQELKNNGVNYERLFHSYQNNFYVKPSNDLKYDDYIIRASMDKNNLKKTRVSITSEQRNLILDLQKEIENLFDIKISLLPVFKNAAKKFKIRYALYHKLLKKRQPEQIYLPVSYGNVPLVKAAKDLGIEVIEMQHGAISKYHLGYGFAEGCFNPDYFPDKLYVWGNYWKEITDIPIGKENVIIYGHKYIQDEKKNYSHIKKEPGTVTILSQCNNNLPEMLLKTLKTKNHNFKFIYKLHPSEYISFQNSEMSGKLKENNIEISKENLYDLFSRSEFIIGAGSTSVPEAIYFGCKPVFMNVASIEYMEEFMNKYSFPLLDESSDLIEVLQDSSNFKAFDEKLISSFFEKEISLC